MRKVSIPFLQPGMVVAKPVYDSEGRLLINAGLRLTYKNILSMKRIGIPAVYIEDPLLEGVEVIEVVKSETKLQIQRNIKKIYTEISSAQSKGVNSKIPAKTVEKMVETLINEILEKKDYLVNLLDIKAYDDYTYAHSVNVCILSLLTGVSLGYSRSKLYSLGVGALLHDLGKIKLPEEILKKPDKLTQEEFNEVKKHCMYGYEILRVQDIPAPSALVAYEHHERYNGEGYPRGLKGSEIHEYAQIAGMVDVYDALTSDRVYRKSFLPHEAFELISGSGNHLYDIKLVKAFVENIAVYLIGTFVELNTGETGVVVGTPKGFPYRPDVRVFEMERGKVRVVREVQLSKDTLTFIKRVIKEEEIAGFRELK
ncbi:MAG TPA: phosphodiesterase [Peptococcaceae bacterium]|nr:MAG: Metal dependent phosphohydrolase [Clostridia bacterium 41_269]HBT20598.1 phosphodiesterase [Peptococcaceae bacterium]